MVIDALEELKKDLQTAKPEDKEGFSQLLRRSMNLLDMSDKELCEQFDVAQPVVIRWRNGLTAPATFIRRDAFNFMLERVQKKLDGNED